MGGRSPLFWVLAVVLVLAVVGFFAQRAISPSDDDSKTTTQSQVDR